MKKRLVCLCLVISVIVGLFALAPVSAASDMKASDSCVGIIKEFEGFSGTPYRDSDGLYTIGYGTRCPADMVEHYKQTPMTPEEAEVELRKEIVTYEKAVNAFIDRHGVSFTQQQFDAVVSLVYNVGPSWLTKGGTLINALTGGATGNELIYAFTIYSMSGGNRSVGHVKRRLAEANVYLNGAYSRTLPDNFAYVIYDGRGGEVSSYNVQGYDADLTAVPMVSATREGYEFKGWYTAASDGTLVTELDHTTKNMTLFAQWEALSGEAPDVVPDTQPDVGGSVPEEKELIVTVTGDDVNIRRGPGLSYGVVATVDAGEKLTIAEIEENDGYTWGKFSKGWIALEYTDYQAESGECNHKYAVSAQKAPTCTLEGSVTYTCGACGDSYTEKKAAIGHDYANATCTSPKKCKVCGATTGTASAHNYSAATCTTPKTCKNCGATAGTALGHSYSGATCTAASKCATCGATSGSALGHSFGNDGVCTRCGLNKGITVTVTGKDVNIRSGPGTSYRVLGTATVGDKLDITETKQVGSFLWGKFSKGWISLRYTDYDKVTGKSCDHDYNVTNKVPTTCTDKGTVTFTCALCGDSYSETAPARGHEYGANGLCVLCGVKDPNFKGLEVVVTANKVNLRTGAGLSYKTSGSVNSGVKLTITDTKQKDGYLWGKSGKGWIALKYTNYNEVLVQSCKHDYSITARKDATCTAKASVTYTCDHCGHSYTETAPAKGHSYAAATCTSPKKCTTCGATSGTALGHKYSEATCTATRKCAICGTTSGNALGHKYGTDGLCDRCNAKDPNYKEPEKPAAVTKTYATVINTDTLNIRKTPNGTIVGMLFRGDKVEILEQKKVNGYLWGRCSKGWIFLHSYGKLETVTEGTGTTTKPDTTPDNTVTVVKTYATVINTDSLNIRITPNGAICGTLKRGTKVEILEQKKVNGYLWGRCSKGWIFLHSYGKLETVKETVSSSQVTGQTGKVTASSLNIRANAGTSYAIVGRLAKGTTVVILEKKTVNGTTWARIAQGWVSMAYIK